MDPDEIKKLQQFLKLQRQLEEIKKLLAGVASQKKKRQDDSQSAEPLLGDESAEYDSVEWDKIIKELGEP